MSARDIKIGNDGSGVCSDWVELANSPTPQPSDTFVVGLGAWELHA